MMIDKRLLKEMPSAKSYIIRQVFVQWIALLCNILIIINISSILQNVLYHTYNQQQLLFQFFSIVLMIGIRIWCNQKQAIYSYEASKDVKYHLRKRIFEKIFALKLNYRQHVSTSELVQLSVEGVDQLEIYFGRYLPQFFYSMIAPLTLFLIFVWIDFASSIVLFLCVPLIPLSIVAVQKFAKKLLSKYWSIYTNLGDSFLDNLQGLTILKIYQADQRKQEEMQEEAQRFRKITMKVLIMQLNSVTIMDFIAYGGAALGSIIAIYSFHNGNLSFGQAICITLLSAEFFLPLRLLGSYFHIAMNGIAASNKIFRLLDLDTTSKQTKLMHATEHELVMKNVNFSYDSSRTILSNISLHIKANQKVAIVGESGCGKSTLAKLLMGMLEVSSGEYLVGPTRRSEIKDESFLSHVVYVTHQPFLMKGTLRDNLKIGNALASDHEMLEILKQVKLYDFVMESGGLDIWIDENGSNLSGGQKQRISIAKALLKHADIYIFDEATSNIDVESEEIILNVIDDLAKEKAVIMITHRLRSIIHCDTIYTMEKGSIVGSGTHQELLKDCDVYAKLYQLQDRLEAYRGGTQK